MDAQNKLKLTPYEDPHNLFQYEEDEFSGPYKDDRIKLINQSVDFRVSEFTFSAMKDDKSPDSGKTVVNHKWNQISVIHSFIYDEKYYFAYVGHKAVRQCWVFEGAEGVPENIIRSVTSMHPDIPGPTDPMSVMRADHLLSEQPWYHGPMSRDAAERLLIKEGDFLVRYSKKKYIVSVRYRNVVQNTVFDTDSVGSLEPVSENYRNIVDFINYHVTNKIPAPIAHSEHTFLRNPIIKTVELGE
uniref:SH2 domain-containing protein n=1 Tax=Rhabditophanes sp. KR3021 TaxID=114890 RepID=A0AC35TRT1_9BILA